MSNSTPLRRNGIGTDTAVYAPLMDEKYTSATRTFSKVEDISELKRTSGATDHTWLVFTETVSWPGPEYRLVGGPAEIPARLGIRGIPFDQINVDIKEAFQLAADLLHRANCGDKFVGSIDLYWPLTAPGLCPEPNYVFTTNCESVISVGAFTGNVHFN